MADKLGKPYLNSDTTGISPTAPNGGYERGGSKRFKLVVGGAIVFLIVAAVIVGIVLAVALSDDDDDDNNNSQPSAMGAVVTLPELGRINGMMMTADNGQELEHYMGIPYAKPPVGDLRWREPQDVEPWGEIDATAYGRVCMASLCLDGSGVPIPESEDCLFMNIFRPRNIAAGTLLPVYIYLYGGGWNIGCSNNEAMDRFVAGGVALGKPFIGVSFNNRNGIFGFLGSEELRDNQTNVSTGNYGIQDQRKALEFVHKYIKHWGGDNTRITLGGSATGACSLTAHMVMPRSMANFEGGKMFSAALVESGLAPNWNAKPMRLATEVYENVKAQVKCADVACLRQTPAEAFTPVLFTYAYQDGPTIYQVFPFAPVIDGVELTDHPSELIRQGKHLKVPLLTGTIRDELASFFVLYNSPAHNATEEDFDRVIAPFVRQNQIAADLAAVKALYSKGDHDYPAHIDTSGFSFWWWATMRAMSDNLYVCPDRRNSILLAGHESVWRYMHVNEPLSPSALLPFMTGPNIQFASNGLGLFYKFNCSQPWPSCEFTEKAEADLAVKVMTSWAEFIETRQLSAPWVQQGTANDVTLLLDAEGGAGQGVGWVIKNNLREAECNLWEDILQATLL